MAMVAEAGGSANGVAQLTAQQLRGIEVGSKLASVGGYAPARLAEGAISAPVIISINFPGGMRETMTIGARAVETEAEAEDSDGGRADGSMAVEQDLDQPLSDQRSPALRGLARSFRAR
jgi:hypothetical protein